MVLRTEVRVPLAVGVIEVPEALRVPISARSSDPHLLGLVAMASGYIRHEDESCSKAKHAGRALVSP